MWNYMDTIERQVELWNNMENIENRKRYEEK